MLLPEVEENVSFVWKELKCVEHETKPPPRYTPATLVSELEKNGIGRPSTYSTILNTLFKRKYIILQKGALIPQEIGTIVVNAMEDHFSGIMDKQFTAKMEEDLDNVALGKENWRDMIREFYNKVVVKPVVQTD